METPVLQPVYGGAEARPFVTHHNALDRVLPGSRPRSTSSGSLSAACSACTRSARTSATRACQAATTRSSRRLNSTRPTATTTRWPAAASSSFRRGQQPSVIAGTSSCTPPFSPRETYAGAILSRTGIDILAHRDVASLREAIGMRVWGCLREGGGLGRTLVDRPALRARRTRSAAADDPARLPGRAARRWPRPTDLERRRLVERFELPLTASEMEIANAYTELNDPDEQRRALCHPITVAPLEKSEEEPSAGWTRPFLARP